MKKKNQQYKNNFSIKKNGESENELPFFNK